MRGLAREHTWNVLRFLARLRPGSTLTSSHVMATMVAFIFAQGDPSFLLCPCLLQAQCSILVIAQASDDPEYHIKNKRMNSGIIQDIIDRPLINRKVSKEVVVGCLNLHITDYEKPFHAEG